MSAAGDGYANDSACAHCEKPTARLLGGWCADCCGLPPVEPRPYLPSEQVQQRVAERLARARLGSYADRTVGALARLSWWLEALAADRPVKLQDGSLADHASMQRAAELAAEHACEDARIAAHAALSLRPDLADPQQRRAA